MKPGTTADLLDQTRQDGKARAATEKGSSSETRRKAPTPAIDSSTPEPDSSGGGGGLVRVTVNLTPKAYEALQRSCELTRDTKTDTINRALLVYNLIQELTEQGGGSLTMVNGNGERERIHIL
jgi:hypothetical protein